MPLNLAEFVTLIQDQIQKSFEYGEHMSKIGRDSDQSDLRVSISEAEVELPIEFRLDEVGVSSEQIQKLVTSGDSIDIANQLLKLPQLNKRFEFALKDRMTINAVENMPVEQNERTDNPVQKERHTKARANKDKDLTLLQLMDSIHMERVKKLQWEDLDRQKHVTLQVANLKPNGRQKGKIERLAGRISLTFKVVDKD